MQKERKGINTIQIAPELTERLNLVKEKTNSPTKAHLARMALDWALSKLETGECEIVNGRLVPSRPAQPA